jgi:hypothetical protein
MKRDPAEIGRAGIAAAAFAEQRGEAWVVRIRQVEVGVVANYEAALALIERVAKAPGAHVT